MRKPSAHPRGRARRSLPERIGRRRVATRAAGEPSRKPCAHRPGGGTAAGPRPVCVLHHPVEQGLEAGPEHHRRRGCRCLHRELQGSRRRRVGRTHRRARFDAGERSGARARQRDGHARSHGDSDVVRHDLQDARGHRRAAAVGLRRLWRRPVEDAEQAGVRAEGPVGPGRGDPRARRRGRRHPAAQNEIGSQKGSTYFARMQYGRLIEAGLER